MPTRRGYVLLAASLFLYGLARASGIDEAYALSAAAFMFPVAAIVFVRLRRADLRFERTLHPSRVFAGRDVRIRLTVGNVRARTGPPLVLEDDAPAILGGMIRYAVPPISARDETILTVERCAAARGRYPIGPLRARLVDPFGLASTVRDVAPAAPLLVYPRVEILSEDAPPEARGGGGRSVIHRLAVAGDDFYGVRGWQDGDDLRKIHWRSTARRGELMIRQDEVWPFPRATIFVDTRVVAHREFGRTSSFEWAMSAAASMVWELARQGFALRLATATATPSGARWGREAVDPLLTSLAVCERSGSRSLLGSIRNVSSGPGAGGALIAVLPPPAPEEIAAFAHARGPYEWRGAMLLDPMSFRNATPRERAVADQRLAESERMLARSGWHVTIASASDTVRNVWQSLLGAGVRRPSSPSLRS